jgi:hypothetical protein
VKSTQKLKIRIKSFLKLTNEFKSMQLQFLLLLRSYLACAKTKFSPKKLRNQGQNEKKYVTAYR